MIFFKISFCFGFFGLRVQTSLKTKRLLFSSDDSFLEKSEKNRSAAQHFGKLLCVHVMALVSVREPSSTSPISRYSEISAKTVSIIMGLIRTSSKHPSLASVCLFEVNHVCHSIQPPRPIVLRNTDCWFSSLTFNLRRVMT